MNQVLDHDHAHHEIEDHDRGLVFDLNTMDRRRVLKLLGFGGLSASLFTIVGCGPAGATGTPLASASATAGQPTAASSAPASGESCAVIPEETAGPFPGDGSNGPNVLSEDGVVRSDIRSSFGSSTTVAAGIPLRDQPHDPGRRRRLRAAGRSRGLSLALRPRGRLLALLGSRSPTRTTCAASRRRTTAAS